MVSAIQQLEADLNEWAEQSNETPDFWDELNAAGNIAEWLVAKGYRKTESP